MLQSIQFNGSGPPTYVYSQKAVGAEIEFCHVFAAHMKGYRGRQDDYTGSTFARKRIKGEGWEKEEIIAVEPDNKTESHQELYQKEYGGRESFLWRQR